MMYFFFSSCKTSIWLINSSQKKKKRKKINTLNLQDNSSVRVIFVLYFFVFEKDGNQLNKQSMIQNKKDKETQFFKISIAIDCRR